MGIRSRRRASGITCVFLWRARELHGGLAGETFAFDPVARTFGSTATNQHSCDCNIWISRCDTVDFGFVGNYGRDRVGD